MERALLARHNLKFIAKIAKGGYSVVYLATDTTTNRNVAVKVIPKSALKSPKDLERFTKEVQTIKTFSHPNIIELESDRSDNDNHILIFKYCAEGDLQNYILENGRIPESTAARIFIQITSALEYCHKCKVAHRDLKPQNILIDKFPHVLIADFGLCGYMKDDSLMTSVCGSPHYVAPEILLKQPYDGKLADIWSLGVLLYTMVNGEVPWSSAQSTTAVVKQITEGRVPVPPHISRDCWDLISKMLVLNMHERISLEEVQNHRWLQSVQRIPVSGTFSTSGERIAMNEFVKPTLRSQQMLSQIVVPKIQPERVLRHSVEHIVRIQRPGGTMIIRPRFPRGVVTRYLK